MTTLEVKLRTAAASNAALVALLGSSPFRWWEKQLKQGEGWPAVTVLRVSTAPYYAMQGQMTTEEVDLQLTCWALQAETARELAQTIMDFLASFDACVDSSNPSPPQSPNFRVSQRGGMWVQTDPPIHQEFLEVKIFNRLDLD